MSGGSFSSSIYLIKVSDENIKIGCEIYSNLNIKTVWQWQWCHSGIFLLPFNYFHSMFQYFYCQIWTGRWQLVYLLLHCFAYNLNFSANSHIQNWCFNFRTSLTEECSDAVAYNDYKSCGKEAGTVKNPNRQDRLIPFFNNQ